MYFVEFKKCDTIIIIIIIFILLQVDWIIATGMTLNLCLMKNCPTFSSVPSSRGETYLMVAWFIMTALSSHLHAKFSAMKQL